MDKPYKQRFDPAVMVERLTAARRAKGWTVRAVADALNLRLKAAESDPVSYETVRRWFADGISTLHSDVRFAFWDMLDLLGLSILDLEPKSPADKRKLIRAEVVVAPREFRLLAVTKELGNEDFEEVLKVATDRLHVKQVLEGNASWIEASLGPLGTRHWVPEEPVAFETVENWRAWIARQVRGKHQTLTDAETKQILKAFEQQFGPPPDRTPPVELPPFEAQPASDDKELASKMRERLRQRVLAGDKKLSGLSKGFSLQEAALRASVRMKIKQGIEENKAIDLVLNEKARTS